MLHRIMSFVIVRKKCIAPDSTVVVAAVAVAVAVVACLMQSDCRCLCAGDEMRACMMIMTVYRDA